MLEETTYYYVTPDGERQGPYTMLELKAMVEQGSIPRSASVLSSANQNWHLLVDVLRGNHPMPMSRRRQLGKCPHCHQDVYAVADVTYGKCPHCAYPLGTPRRVSGVRRQVLFTLWKRYFCFSGRAVRTEYWSFFAAMVFGMTVVGLLGFCILLLSVDDFNVHLTNGRSFYELVRDSGGYGMAHYVFAGMVVVFSLLFITPMSGVTVRRLHDAGFSGLWYLPALVMPLAFTSCAFARWLEPGLYDAWQGTAEIVFHPGYIIAMIVAMVTVLIVLPCRDSLTGPNKYGPSPKYPH